MGTEDVEVSTDYTDPTNMAIEDMSEMDFRRLFRKQNRCLLVKVGPDAYLDWVRGCDAPGSCVMTRADLLEAGEDPARIDRVDERGHSAEWMESQAGAEFMFCNRAGPDESCLTFEALLRKYASPEASASFVATPQDIQPVTTSFAVSSTDDPEYGRIYWVPWPPGEAPAALDASVDLHAMVFDAELTAKYAADRAAATPTPPA